MCADFAFAATQGDIPPASSNGRASNPKWMGGLGIGWARHEVRASSLQAEHIKQHTTCEVHRLAVAHFMRPDAPVKFLLQETLDDERLLYGGVPGLADWIGLL